MIVIKGRKSSTHSLEMLIQKKHEEEFKKQSTILSLPDVDMNVNTVLPPLPTVSGSQGKRKLSRTDSKKSISSGKSEQSAKLAEMLGVSQPVIPEENIEAIAESTAAEALKAVEKQIPFVFGSIPSTPEIQKAAETTVTDVLRNVIGPQYDPKSSELQVTERLQTTTRASPSGSREDLPVVGEDTAGTSAITAKQRPGSGTSNRSKASVRSRTTLPSPTIEPNQEETTANLDAVAEALSQLPPIPVPSLPKLDGKHSSNTSPSTARKKKKSASPKTARSLTSEKSIKFTTDSPKSARKTISSALKERPSVSKRKPQNVKQNADESESDFQQTQPSHIKAEQKSTKLESKSPRVPRKQLPPITSEPSKPVTGAKTERSKSVDRSKTKLPPIYRQSSSTSLKPKRVSSNPPTRQLSSISERSENVQIQAETSSISKYPISLPSSASGSPKAVLKRPNSKNSKLPQLVDPKKASKVFCQCEEPEYMVADLDLDLPGPFMVPASSIEDLKRVGASRLPRLTSASKSEPSSERFSKNSSLPRQSSTKSEDLWKSNRLPPIDVDLDDDMNSSFGIDTSRMERSERNFASSFNMDSSRMAKSESDSNSNFDIDTSRVERTEKHASSTIARKIASRKAGYDYPMKRRKQKSSNESSNNELQYEYKRPKSNRVHDGCLKNQPPWDPTPLKDGEMEKIPFDWNLSRSNSNMSFSGRRTQSQGDIRRVTSLKIYSSFSPRTLSRENKSNSLTNLFHIEARIPEMDPEWVNSLKTSLKKTNNWLDYD